MLTFFHGWRRKAGVVTLVLALAVMGGWFRSQHTFDVICVHGPIGLCSVVSSSDGKLWLIRRTDSPNQSFYSTGQVVPGRLNSLNIEWRWNVAGFSCGQVDPRVDELHLALITFPHWSIAFPFAILSAYLLLVPSRKPPTASQPHA
jgi:hypothetical protein